MISKKRRLVESTERVLDRSSFEYNLLAETAKELNLKSPNNHRYVVRDTYLDYGQDWMWTTIIDTTANVQVLNPREWKDLVDNGVAPSTIADQVLSDKYCQDKPLKEEVSVKLEADEPEELANFARCVLGDNFEFFNQDFGLPTAEVDIPPRHEYDAVSEIVTDGEEEQIKDELVDESLNDNAVKDCKKYKVVAHCKEEKPVCTIEKPVLPPDLTDPDLDMTDEEFYEAFGKALKEKRDKELKESENLDDFDTQAQSDELIPSEYEEDVVLDQDAADEATEEEFKFSDFDRYEQDIEHYLEGHPYSKNDFDEVEDLAAEICANVFNEDYYQSDNGAMTYACYMTACNICKI